MSELAPLREAVNALAGRTSSPDFGELERRATRRGRRRMAVVVAACTLALIAAGGGLASETLRGSDQLAPIGGPGTPSPEPPSSPLAFGEALDALLEPVPGWNIYRGPYPTGFDYAFNGPCSGRWSEAANGGGDGGAPYSRSSDGMGHARFATEAQASASAATFAESLSSCTTTAWQTQPIARTGGVLASSPDAVAWIQRTGDTVTVLQVRTADGPPPVDVQVAVAEWIVAYRTWSERS